MNKFYLKELRLNLGRSSFSETIDNSCIQYHRYCSKGHRDVCPGKQFCVDCSRGKSEKWAKWYHLALLATLYFFISLRTKLVWSCRTTSRQIVGKWNPRQLVGNKKTSRQFGKRCSNWYFTYSQIGNKTDRRIFQNQLYPSRVQVQKSKKKISACGQTVHKLDDEFYLNQKWLRAIFWPFTKWQAV